jgi:predicted phage baseplate assembly protein
MAKRYFCKVSGRRQAVLDHADFNGIDYLEVADRIIGGLDDPKDLIEDDDIPQARLVVAFLKEVTHNKFGKDNVRIDGSGRVRHIKVVSVLWPEDLPGDLPPERRLPPNCVEINLDSHGDFSVYTLRIVEGLGHRVTPDWLDPVLGEVEFSFKAACPSDFDCAPVRSCPTEPPVEPDIDYLAKDYASFRQLMLDRLSTVMPQWRERNPTDLGVAAVEVLAYAADQLSYYQDAVATEAYLGTARRRVSVRRHARLLDYAMHDGCNARAWVHVAAGENARDYVLRAHTPLLTGSEWPEAMRMAVQYTPRPPKPLVVEDFVALAAESLCLASSAHVHSGHVGAALTLPAGPAGVGDEGGGGGGHGHGDDDGDGDGAPAPCPDGWSVYLDSQAQVAPGGPRVYGDRVYLSDGAKVYDVYANTLEGAGTVKGQHHQPLKLPLFTRLPVVPDITPGSEDILVAAQGSQSLAAGRYGQLSLAKHATLTLLGGRYDFSSWEIGDHATVVFQDACDIRIAGRLQAGDHVQMRAVDPAAAPGARAIVIRAGALAPDDAAIAIGDNGQLLGVIQAAAGAAVFGKHTHLTGAVYARRIVFDEDAQLHALPPAAEALEPWTRICLDSVPADRQVFETMHDIVLHPEHNAIEFYTWGDDDCCLPQGATRASLRNPASQLDALKIGDLLLFEEISDASGSGADADRQHRHVVRLTALEKTSDPLYSEGVLNIGWAPEDALPFPLCLRRSAPRNGDAGQPVSVARGNIVLADHGSTRCNEPLVPPEVTDARRYRPHLQRTGIVQAVPFDAELARSEPASAALAQDPRATLPAVALSQVAELWTVRRDLLASDRFSEDFVVETENDGRAYLRFGDGVLGRRPLAGTRFLSTYRLGGGTAGNVGANTLKLVVIPAGERIAGADISATNPLPARGGVGLEEIEHVRLYAPQAFRSQRRAVVPADYAALAEDHPEVQKAVATQRWTGSWHTVFVTVDRRAGRPVDDEFETELRAYLEPYRIMGHDLEIEGPRLVALDIVLRVCLAAGYLRSAVKKALLDVFSSGRLADGGLGFFHPDRMTFGEPIYLSAVIAAAMQVSGVAWVAAERFGRWGEPDGGELGRGRVDIGRLEIARLDNDPNAPNNGRLDLIMEGGL